MNWLANYPFFFDGPEYVALSRLPVTEALMQAHPLAHPVSIWLSRLAYLGLGESVAAQSLVSWLFWVGGTIIISRWVERERRLLFWAVCWLLPLPWLVMTNVGVDAVSTGLFAAGVGILVGRKSWMKMVVATTLLGLSVLNYLGMLVWLVIPAGMIVVEAGLTGRQKLIRMATLSLSGVMGLGGLVALGVWKGVVGVGSVSVLRAIYHAGVAFVVNYTWVSALVVVGSGGYWVYKRSWRELGILIGVGAIYVVSMLPWHSGPYGRLGIMVVYLLAWLYTRLPKTVGVLALLLVIPNWWSVWSAYQTTPLPILEQRLLNQAGCENKQVILSEIQRPQLANNYPAAWYVGPNNWEEVGRKIETKKEEGGGWCISQQALDFPYRQFEGQLPYPLSGSKKKEGFLSLAISNEKLEVVSKEDKHPELTIYTISR